MSDASSLALEPGDTEALQKTTDAIPIASPEKTASPIRILLKKTRSVPNFQLWVILAAALFVTLILAILIWPESHNYRTLYFGLSDKDTSAIAEQLQKAGIDYQIDKTSGNLRVDEGSLYDARLKIASAGLPRGTGRGLEFLDESPDIGRSQFAEHARYHHALEREIARSIASIASIEKARVHLAIPKKTVFIRERHQPTASVIVFLYPGRSLGQGQVMAIQHLVSSSVPDLQNEQISVIDQRGRLLSTSVNDPGMKTGFEHLQYTAELEERYIRRIEELLAPVVGVGKIQAQVTADLDFSQHESSSERFIPNPQSIRSEQLLIETQGNSARGVPGATSNEPPSPAQFTEDNTLRNGNSGSGPAPKRRRDVRNYELDRVISHDQRASVILKRLSIAVVVGKGLPSLLSRSKDEDESAPSSESAAPANTFSQQELEQLTVLIKNAVGFNAERGDTINIVNAHFSEPQAPQQSPWWESQSSLTLIEYGLAAIMFLILLILVFVPLLRSARSTPPPLTEPGALSHDADVTPDSGLSVATHGPLDVMDSDKQTDSLPVKDIISQLLPEGFGDEGDYESYVKAAQTIARENPRRAAEVLKIWILDNV